MGPLRRVKFLITAPFIVLLCLVINFFRLMRDIVVLGGLAAFGAYIFNRNRQS